MSNRLSDHSNRTSGMKYTTDLPDDLVIEGRLQAEQRGITFEEPCVRAIRKEITTSEAAPLSPASSDEDPREDQPR
jgi:hypothetical protein